MNVTLFYERLFAWWIVIPLGLALVTTASFWKYWGIGLRWGLDGSIAYTTSFGAAVRIERRTGRPFVVSTHRPQELKATIVKLIKSP